jgi:hypothetical protein
MSNAGGKGSGRRPAAISDQQYADRYDEIFQREKVEELDVEHDPAKIRQIFEKEDEQ